MRYLAAIDPSNKNNSHTLTIDFIGESAGQHVFEILDVGCSAGYLGEYLKTKGHRVTGIDITPEAIEAASKFLDEAYCMRVEDFFAANPDRQFDVVIFGDVLEHVTNAEEVLRLTAQHLKPRGRVIASIPNVAHLAVRAMLLEGRWEYATLGLLDRDHVRFFTRDSILKLFASCGFDVKEMRCTRLPVETVDQLCGMNLNPEFVEIAKTHTAQDDSTDVFQYVAMAQMDSAAPRVVCLAPDITSGLFEFRLKNPLENWARRHDGAVRFRVLGEHRPEDLLWGDVFVFERMGGAYTQHMIKTLKQHGKRVVFEIDDLLTELPDFLAHHRLSPEAQQSLLDSIAGADIVTTTTPRLAKRLTDINPNVICVPNCISDPPAERAAHQEDTQPIATLIVASSDSVLVSFLIEPLKVILKKHGASVKLVVVGPIGRALEKGGLIFEQVPVLSYKDFVALLQTLTNPIGLIPLDDSVFSSCKSPIKFFDYAISSIPAICSNVPPYSDYVVNRDTGLLVNNQTEKWVEAIETLIGSLDLRIQLSAAARQYVMETHLADRAGDAWQTVIERLQIQRVDVPGLVEAAESYRPKLSIGQLIQRLLRPQTISKGLRVLRNEGMEGVKKKIAKW